MQGERSSPLSTPPRRIHFIRLSPTSTHGENLTASLPLLLMIGAFSTRPPAMAFIPGVRLVLSLATVHQLLSVRCSTPRDTRTKRQNNTHCELYGGLIMLTSRITAPPPLPISERLRWNIACSGNCLPPANSSYYFPRRQGVWSVFGVVEIVLCYNNAARQRPQRIDLYRAANGR